MPGAIHHIFPFLRTPFTDLGGHIFTHQAADKCNDFEMRAVECLEAYGLTRGEKECKDYVADLHECVFATKSNARYKAMEDERLRQYKAGELSKEDMYPLKSRVDGY